MWNDKTRAGMKKIQRALVKSPKITGVEFSGAPGDGKIEIRVGCMNESPWPHTFEYVMSYSIKAVENISDKIASQLIELVSERD
jgi:hypothetical protein